MRDYLKFYIDGDWVDPVSPKTLDVENPATEEIFARISLGSEADVDRAVSAARDAFETFSTTRTEYRADLLDKIIYEYKARMPDIAHAIMQEMGAPKWLAETAQAGSPLKHFMNAARDLRAFQWETSLGSSLIVKEPIGVCGFITPWNWPTNQIACKVAPAIAMGCTIVLKPSEIAPLDAIILAEILHDAGVPKGVFNLVNGDGPGVGQAIAAHPDIDMVSFTGSTRAGVEVARAAALNVKRVCQELGGKSPNVILPCADIENAVKAGVRSMMMNSGQSCNAPSRMLIPKSKQAEAEAVAKQVGESFSAALPELAQRGQIGPISNRRQFEKVQALIQKGVDAGATLLLGGVGRPEDLEIGYFTRPTIFTNVSNQMEIAREEIFGPVLVMIPYEDEEEAIAIANDTPYGLAAYVSAEDIEKARNFGRKIRAGQVLINGAGIDLNAPFGGYKQSGNGREWGVYGFEDFLETKAMPGGA